MKNLKLIPIVMLLIAASLSVNASCFNSGGKGNKDSNLYAITVLPQKDTLNKKVKAFKKEWNKKIAKLGKQIAKDKRKIKESGNTNKAKLKEEIAAMQSERGKLQMEVNEAGNKTQINWDEFKEKVSNDYNSLYMKASNFLKQHD